MSYFEDYHYDIFKEEYQDKNSKDIRSVRKEIQDRLLELKEDLDLKVIPYNLYTHWKKENITSLLFPCEYNHGKVNWIGLRYGRSKREIALLNKGRDLKEDPFLGFQKYNCFQVDISLDGLDIGIYHSVPNDAVDRMYVREHIEDPEFQEALKPILEDLLGYGYRFSVGQLGAVSNKWETKVFEFDAYYGKDVTGENIIDEFTKFYKKYVTDGTHSSLLYHYPRYDERITQKELIEYEFMKHIERLYPLYKQLSWNIKVK